jgi:hypothetical protein
MREFVVLSSISPVSVTKEDGVKGIKVSGTAVAHAGGKPNLNGLIYPIETIKQYASSLSGYPMVIDHESTIANTVGKVKNAYEKNGDLLYDADINEEHPSGIAKMLERKDVNSVSIMAKSNNIECNICNEAFGLCPHQPLQKYDGKVAAGIVHHLSWKHLSFVLDPADPYATDSAIASQNEHNYDAINKKQMIEICQQFSELDCKKEQIIKQKVKIMDEKTVSQKEVETLVKTVTKEKDLKIKETEAEVKQKEAEVATLLKKMEEIKATNLSYENKEKEKLISQICELSGEKPESYSDMTVTQLERLHTSVVSYDKKFKKKDDGQTIDQSGAGNLNVGQPDKPPVYDEDEEGIKFIQYLFDLKSEPLEDDAKTVIKFISQSEVMKDGIKIRSDK